jgi:hypothetical protein
VDEALTAIEERVLLDLTLCWRIIGIDAGAVKAFAVPADASA